VCGSVSVCVRETAASKTTPLLNSVPCPSPRSKQASKQRCESKRPIQYTPHGRDRTPRHLPLSTTRLPGRIGRTLRPGVRRQMRTRNHRRGQEGGGQEARQKKTCRGSTFDPPTPKALCPRSPATTTPCPRERGILHVWSACREHSGPIDCLSEAAREGGREGAGWGREAPGCLASPREACHTIHCLHLTALLFFFFPLTQPKHKPLLHKETQQPASSLLPRPP